MKNKIITLLLALFVIPQLTIALDFADVPPDNVYYLPIHVLRAKGFVTGFPDNTYRPNEFVNRATAARVILTAYENSPYYPLTVEPLDPAGSYPDIDTTAAYAKYLVKAEQFGLFVPDELGFRYPQKAVTRAEFFKLLLAPSNIDFDQYDDEQIYSDVPNYAWFAKYMNFAGVNGMVIADKDNNLQPSKELSRGEATEMGYVLFMYVRHAETALVLEQLQANMQRSLYYLSVDKRLAAKRSAAFAVGLGQQLYYADPTNDIFVANSKLAKALSFTINYLILINIEGKAEFAEEWLLFAQEKLSEAIVLDPTLTTTADQISALWPTP